MVTDEITAHDAAELVPTANVTRRILLVDDNVDGADLLGALSQMGHVTRIAYDGPSALAVAATFAPDLVLLDIGLPLIDGYELAQQLRAAPHLGPLQLVALTATGSPWTVVALRPQGSTNTW
jgi:CheY-like chemotaxis protein